MDKLLTVEHIIIALLAGLLLWSLIVSKNKSTKISKMTHTIRVLDTYTRDQKRRINKLELKILEAKVKPKRKKRVSKKKEPTNAN